MTGTYIEMHFINSVHRNLRRVQTPQGNKPYILQRAWVEPRGIFFNR